MILCTSEAVIDMFHKNDPIWGEVFYPLPGGCSYNTSIAIGRLGSPVAFLGRLSKNFFGEIQFKRLRENNVNIDLLVRCEQNPILAFIKTEEGQEPQYAFYDEGTADRLLTTEDLPALPSNIACIACGSISMCMEPLATTIETLILKEAAKKTVIAFDPNIRPFMIKDRDAYMKCFEKWVSISTIAKISSEDFEYIFPNTESEEALHKIIDIGTPLAIVTLGSQGAVALLKRGDGSVIKVRAPAAHIPKIADTVGAGDTFQGALLAWLEQKGKLLYNEIVNLSETELHAALVFANKAAAIVCTRHGAEPPTLKEIE